MRLCDFLKKIDGDFDIKIYKDRDTLIEWGTIEQISNKCDESFDAIDGFSDEMFEKTIKDWKIKDKVICVLINN